MMKKFHLLLDPIMWLFLAWMLWAGEAPRTNIESMRVGYKVLALVLVALVVFDVASRIYFRRKLAALEPKDTGA